MRRRALASVALATLACGCFRALRPALEDAQAEAGVPVSFGAEGGPPLEWEFGDGVRKSGPSVQHAFARAGTYVVRARRGGTEVASATIKVHPRPLLHAVPPQATLAIWLPRLKGHLETAVDFLERLIGADTAQRWLDEQTLGSVAMELAASDRDAIDLDEGLGIFSLPGFDGSVALLGVADEERAMDVAVQRLEEKGGLARAMVDGSIRVRLGEGDAAVFADRGYLYMAVPGDGGDLDGEALDAVVQMVRSTPADGLNLSSAVSKASPRVPDGTVRFYFGPPPEDVSDDVAGVVGSVALGQNAAELNGFVVSSRPLWVAPAAATSALLARAPEGAVAAASISLPPEDLGALLAGGKDSARRRRLSERFRRDGLDLTALLEALAGDVSVLVYFDAESYLLNLVNGSERPEPRGSVLIELGLRSATPLEAWVDQALASAEVRYDRVRENGFTSFRFRYLDQPVELSIDERRARLKGGTGLEGRKDVDLVQALSAKLGEGAFGAGHATLLVDLGQLRKELEEPRIVEGADPRRVVMAQGFSSALLDQMMPVDHLYLDLSPDALGGKLRGRLVLKARRKDR